ncbi:MAG: hypothetical protein ACLP1D_26620 [Xanthobacteraceae bacterium]
MAAMTYAGSSSTLGSEFDSFLFASIGEDSNGMPVSVLSGLARSNLDPWQEAAQLSALPGPTAVERLTALIGALPGKAWTHAEAQAVATRLIALLPHALAAHAGSGRPPQSLAAAIPFRPWWIYVAIVSLVLGSQMILANRMSAPADHAASNPAANVSPRPPLGPPSR